MARSLKQWAELIQAAKNALFLLKNADKLGLDSLGAKGVIENLEKALKDAES